MGKEIIKDIDRLMALLDGQENEKTERRLKGPKGIYDFGATKDSYRRKSIEIISKRIKENTKRLIARALSSESPEKIIPVLEIIKGSIAERELLQQLKSTVLRFSDAKADEIRIKAPAGLPYEIREDISDDIRELEKTFNSGCFRAAVILCGRILETALHRKYFEATGIDILEKSPGIGLGKLIAKMSEKKISLDPGISQQIHLINQVRIYSVHKKHESFYPTKAQAYAMILYTIDILEKLFGKHQA